MHSIFAGIHFKSKSSEFLQLQKLDFEKDVLHLKKRIAEKFECDATKLELIYNGTPLEDELKLSAAVRPNGTVHCFTKTEKYKPYQPTADAFSAVHTQELFNVTAHVQINVNSRMNILHKILAEYPEFRRNLGAQALIRDSVLFNTLHQPEVVKNIAENYPIICEAAPFIVDTIKKELKRSTSSTNFSEPATDSTNSSEEENSLGATSSSGNNADNAADQPSDNIRLISRQQLQAALAQIGVGGSHNSLSNIAQRNTDSSSTVTTTAAGTTTTGSAPLSSSASGERISSEVFRNQLQRALNAVTQQMDTSEASSPPAATGTLPVDDASSGEIPAYYRTHQYAEQLRTMAQMGFVNYDENLTYLNITNGDIENAINLLVGSMN